jgi:glycerol-1-phosphate dehydrogenase [NAD(P)+]
VAERTFEFELGENVMKINIERFSGKCSCGHTHGISVKGIYIEPKASRYLKELIQPYKCPIFICDSNTKKASEEILKEYYDKNNVVELSGQEIHADNMNVAHLSQLIRDDADLLIAVGAGTIHDLTRYIAYEKGIPFISMPTAASVDGFVSTVAAMTWNGLKKTFTAKAPIYVLADTDIFSRAPYRMTASGISDLMGKYTALIDWRISHIITGEYFCSTIYELQMEAVREVESILGEIKSGKGECMEKLMYALLLSGLAMQMIGNSRPASGAEHHISHLWEMSVINEPVDALHGEKVSVGLMMCLEKYEEILTAIKNGKCQVKDNADFETELLQDTFGRKGLYESVLEENGENLLKSINLNQLENQLQDIAVELKKLPKSDEMKQKLKKADCMTSMQELNLPDIKELTLALSPYVRRRLTLMRLSKLFNI